jgi:hypothetical protein
MEKRVVSLLGGPFFLLLAGIVLYLWVLFDPGAGSVAVPLPIALVLLGGLGLNISWALHDLAEWLTRLERGREGGAPPAKPGEAGPAAVSGRPRD